MKQTLDLRRIGIFLAFAFGIAWAIALVIYLTGGLLDSPEILPGISLALALVALGYMWAPALGHILTRLLTREGWKDNGLPLNLERWGTWALAWVLPALLTILGTAIYFLVFSNQFDPQLGILQQLTQAAEAQTGRPIGMDLWTLFLVQLGQAVFIAPLINGFFTFGEEYGWRAYLQTKLMALGFRKAVLILGIIWGVWHWPLIAMGHNYGFFYWGAPWLGMLAMVWFTLGASVIFGWLTLRGRSVWPAVIAHGATNGIAGAGVLLLRLDASPNPLLGPAAVGLIANIPWLVLALYLLWKGAPADVSRETSAPQHPSPAKNVMVASRGLTKHFGKLAAVEGLNVDIPAGEVFGLLGPNGAGKTITIRLFCGLIAPTAGEAWVTGYRLGENDGLLRKSVGILTETPGMYEQLSAQRNLAFFAQLYEVEKVEKQVERYLRWLGLWARRNEPVGTFSKGMRQKLAIARALLHEPKVLFLDEPTSGLDPEAARLVRDFISELKQEGRTIVLCTHNLDEADRLCDRVAVFKTRLLALDTPTNLRRQLFGRAVVFHLDGVKPSFAKALRQKEYVQDVEVMDNKLVVKLDDPEARNPELISDLVGLGAKIRFVGELRQSLEDVYLQLIGNEDRQ